MLSSFSHARLCKAIDSSPPGSSVQGILQVRILEWVAISFSNACMHAKSLQLCPTLCDPMDSSQPGPLPKGFSRQEYWNGLPFPSPVATVCIHFFLRYYIKSINLTHSVQWKFTYTCRHIFSFHLYYQYPNEDRCFQDARGLPHVLPLSL